jgi:hypothetical protein
LGVFSDIVRDGVTWENLERRKKTIFAAAFNSRGHCNNILYR